MIIVLTTFDIIIDYIIKAYSFRLSFEGYSGFTARELDIIRLLVQGRSNRQIAAELYLSVGTVKNYLTQIYMKINVKDRGNAILYLKKIGF